MNEAIEPIAPQAPALTPPIGESSPTDAYLTALDAVIDLMAAAGRAASRSVNAIMTSVCDRESWDKPGHLRGCRLTEFAGKS
jgi:hypothetical protein